jgi:hypothetical protein
VPNQPQPKHDTRKISRHKCNIGQLEIKNSANFNRFRNSREEIKMGQWPISYSNKLQKLERNYCTFLENLVVVNSFVKLE